MLQSNTIRGGLIIIAAMSVIGLIDNFVPYIAETSGVWQFHFIRSIEASLLVLIYCLAKKVSIVPKRFWPVCIRSFFMASSMILYFGSLSLMPIAETGAAMFSSPIFVLLFSVMLFGTKVGIWRIFAVFLGFAGMLLVLKPDPVNLSIITFIPIFAGSIYALAQLFTRHYCAEENISTVLLGFLLMIGLVGAIGMLVLTFIDLPEAIVARAPFFFTGWTGISSRFMLWTTFQAVGSCIAVAGLIKGYQIAEPSLVTVFEFSFLVFAGLWGWILWKQMLDMFSIFGIACIIVAGTIISFRASRSVQYDTSKGTS